MTSSREALYQAVLDDPSADAPRLAYAAFCDAHGDPYGAFIRAQLEWTNELRDGTVEGAQAARKQASQIQAQHGKPEWKQGVNALGARSYMFRGFVDSVTIDARTYLERRDELYRRVPVRQLLLTHVGDLAPQIASDPRLAQLVSLTFAEDPIGDAGLAAIVASPHLRALKLLQVSFQNLTMAGLEALCVSKQLPSLIYVNVAGNKFPTPDEEFSTDWMSGYIVRESIQLPPLGEELERKYGDLAWLHGPSRLRNFPIESAQL